MRNWKDGFPLASNGLMLPISMSRRPGPRSPGAIGKQLPLKEMRPEDVPAELAWLPVLPDPPTITVTWRHRLRIVHPAAWLGVLLPPLSATSAFFLPTAMWLSVVAVCVAWIAIKGWRMWQRIDAQCTRLIDGYLTRPSEFCRGRMQAALDMRDKCGQNYIQHHYRCALQFSRVTWLRIDDDVQKCGYHGQHPCPSWWALRKHDLWQRAFMVLQPGQTHYVYLQAVQEAFWPMAQAVQLVKWLGYSCSMGWSLEEIVDDWLADHAEQCPPLTAIMKLFVPLGLPLVDAWWRRHDAEEERERASREYRGIAHTRALAVSRELMTQARQELSGVLGAIARERSGLDEARAVLARLPASAYGAMAAEVSRRAEEVSSLELRANNIRREIDRWTD